MKTDNNDKTLVEIYAKTYGWHIASVRPGNRDGAAEVAEAYRGDGTIPFHVKTGQRREREAILNHLSDDGYIVVTGNTQDRRAGLTWPGVCRATALTVGAVEIGQTFKIMDQVSDHAKQAGGEHVSPSGSVPEYLLVPELGQWWSDCTLAKNANFKVDRSRLFYRLLPALAMRWVNVAADCHGFRWYHLSPAGLEALNKRPAIPRGLPKETLTDFYLTEGDKAWEIACNAKPKDKNAVHIGVPASLWWTVKGGAK